MNDLSNELRILREEYHSLPYEQQLNFVSKMDPKTFETLRYHSPFFLRDKQIFPEDFSGRYYLALAGRGFGKTKMGAFAISQLVHKNQKGLAIVAPTFKDLEDFMVPAIMNEFPEHQKPRYYSGNKSKIVCYNGIEILCYTSETEIRGGNFTFVWCDELVKWCGGSEEKAAERFSILDFGVRIGKSQFLITTSAKPWKILIDWQDRFLKKDKLIHIVTGKTSENNNISSKAKEAFIAQYAGTRLGRQELNGEILNDVEGALWTYEMLDKARSEDKYDIAKGLLYPKRIEVTPLISYPFQKIVVSIDPAATSNKRSDETGIIVAAITNDGKIYVLEDASGRYTPDKWARKAIELFNIYQADRIIVETNQGGDMVENTLRSVSRSVPIKRIHATRGKILRAEPVAALYEQEKVRHLKEFTELERQMCTYTADSSASPDRLDALVYAITELANLSVASRKIDTRWVPHF